MVKVALIRGEMGGKDRVFRHKWGRPTTAAEEVARLNAIAEAQGGGLKFKLVAELPHNDAEKSAG